MRSLVCCFVALTVSCAGFYRIPPDQLYRVSASTRVQDASGEVKTLKVAKVYATLQDGRNVSVLPQNASALFFDENLDERYDVELAVINAPATRRSALVGCAVGLVASGALGVVSSRCEEDIVIQGVDGTSSFTTQDCGIDFGDALAVLFGAGIYFCPLGSGLGVLWERSNPADVDVLPKRLATSP